MKDAFNLTIESMHVQDDVDIDNVNNFFLINLKCLLS